MSSLHVLVLCLVTLPVAVLVQAEIVCQDLQEEILCSETKEAGNCYQHPWNGKCRKTCGRCDDYLFSCPDPTRSFGRSVGDLDECYDAQNLVTCEDEKDKGHCDNVEVAHICSQTCQVLACSKEANKRQLDDKTLI